MVKLEELALAVKRGTTALACAATQASPHDKAGDPTDACFAAALTAALPGASLVGHDWHDWNADPVAQGTRVSLRPASLPGRAPDPPGPRADVWLLPDPIFTVPHKTGSSGSLLTARTAAATAALNALPQKD